MKNSNMSLSSRVASLQPTAVNSILAEVRQARAANPDIVSLMRGEPDLPTPPHIVEAAVRALRDGRTAYPDNRGEPRLREAVAAKLLRDNGLAYEAGSEILVTTGATFGIYAALAALLNEGDSVLLPDPVYDAYLSPIRLAGARPVPVASRIVKGRFSIPAEALEEAWTPECRALLLNTPWNPTGTVLRRDEIEAIAEFCLRRGLFLISDEIYEAIVYGGGVHVSPALLGPELRARTVLVNSLSKTYSMTGWRVGYCAATPEVAQAMFLVLQQSSRGPSTFVQDAAAEALAGPQDAVVGMRDEYARRRELVIEALSGCPGCNVLAPEGGFFAMLDVRALGLPSATIRRSLLNGHGVVVVHGSAYGAAGEGTLRVSFASGGDTLRAGLVRLRAGLEALETGRKSE